MRPKIRLALLSLIAVPFAAPMPSAEAQWLNDPGAGWVQATIYHHDTRRHYDALQNHRDFPEEGHAVTTSLFLTAAFGIAPGLDAWIQAPIHRLRFDDIIGERLRTGLGDPRFYLRAGPSLFGLRTVPVAVRAGVKLPGGSFPVDANIIPLGEGQRDWEVMIEFGRSFYPLPLYAAGWVGYRLREENTGAARKPGNERFMYLSAGGQLGPIGWKLAAEGLHGDPWLAQGIRLPTARRRMIQITPTLGYALGPGSLELGARFPLQGQNLPAGPAFILGYFMKVRVPGHRRQVADGHESASAPVLG